MQAGAGADQVMVVMCSAWSCDEGVTRGHVPDLVEDGVMSERSVQAKCH